MSEHCAQAQEPAADRPAPADLPALPPKGAKTSDYYKIGNIPSRFDNPGHQSYSPGNPVFTCEEEFPSPPSNASADWFEGYGGKDPHPMYMTSSQDYGRRPPTVHTMPTTFNGKSQKFSNHLGKCGMPRNHSLNTGMDQSPF